MWFVFDSLEEKKGCVGRSGKVFDAWILKGTKKGYEDTPDAPYEKTIFDTSVTSITEKGIHRDGISVLQYFQKQAKKGDTFVIKSERDGKFWRWAHIEKLGEQKAKPEYTPLTDEQAEAILNAKQNIQAAGSEDTPW